MTQSNHKKSNRKRAHKNEWGKPLITSILFLLLFLVFNTEIIFLFDEFIIPVLSTVNEGIISSIVFSVLLMAIVVFWTKRFIRWYYVKPLHILLILLWCVIYLYYRFFTSDYNIIESELLFLGFSDIIGVVLTLWCITAIFVDLLFGKSIKRNKVRSKNDLELQAPHYSLEDDNPITRRDNDILGFGDDVDVLFNEICTRNNKTSFSIGITARWGDGKSSYINLLEEKLRQYDDYFIIIRFNPRYSSNDNIQSAFFELLFSQLSEYDSRFKNSFNDYLKVIDVMAENKYLSAILRTTRLFNREDEKDKINSAIKRLNKRIVVIIEDLDRLMKDEIVEVLKLIDGNAAFDNLIFISAYDKKRVNTLLESNDEQAPYSDKFFTRERPLPLRFPKLLLNYLITNIVRDLPLKNEEVEEIKHSIISDASFFTSYLKNLRDVKRYINLVKPPLSRIYKEVKIRDFLLIELVKFKYQDEYRTLYEQNYHKDSETNFKRKIIIDGLEDQFKSKDILKVLFPADGNSSYRSINSVGGFSIYFQEHLFERISNKQLSSMFEMDKDFRALINEILNNNGWNQLNEYLGSLNTLSLQSWDAVVRYIDIYIYLSAHYNENLYSILNVGILLEKRVVERLCKKFEISIDNYKSTLYHKLTGGNNEYPYKIVKQQLWAYKSGEIRHELVLTENDLLVILKNSLKDLIKNNPDYTALHNNILRACISFIDPNSKKVTLDTEACEMVLHSIESKPDEYINDFVFLAGVSSSPDWNSVTCDPFWRQIFLSAENLKDFIFNEKLDGLHNIKRVRNFWTIFEANNYEPIEFQDQGPVQAKIDSDLVTERKLLDEILNIESVVNSITISQDSFVDAYKVLKDSLERLDSNTLYIKKNGDVRKSIFQKREELKLFRDSEPLEITPEILGKIKTFENYLNEHLMR